MDVEENKLQTFNELRQICCNFFSNKKPNIMNALSNLILTLLKYDCNNNRKGGIESFNKEYEIKQKISELLGENINSIVLNEEESLLHLKTIEQNNLWINSNFGIEGYDYSMMNNLLDLLTKNYNKPLDKFSIGIKSIKTKEMMNNYVTSIINFIPLLPNQIIILFSPIYWSLFIYNFLFSSMIKDKIFNIELFHEPIDNVKIVEETFMKELKEEEISKDSIISKLIMMRIDPLKKSIIEKPNIDIKESNETIINDLNLLMEIEYRKEFENYRIDTLITIDLIPDIIGPEYPYNQHRLINSIIYHENLTKDNKLLIKFTIYIILTNFFDRRNNPFPESFVNKLRNEYHSFIHAYYLLKKVIPDESILKRFKELEEAIKNNNTTIFTKEDIDDMKILYIKYKIDDKQFPGIHIFFGSSKHIINNMKIDNERLNDFIENYESIGEEYGLSSELISRLNEMFIPYKDRDPSNVLTLSEKKLKSNPLIEETIRLNIMPNRTILISILTDKLKELFDEIHNHWIHIKIDKKTFIKTFYCIKKKPIIQSRFFNILIGLCKNRYWTLTEFNVTLTLYDYFDDITFNMNNQDSLLFPENITIYDISGKISLIDIYISNQSFYHTLFDNNFDDIQLYMIEVLKKNDIKYEYFYVDKKKPIIAINNTNKLLPNHQVFIRNNFFSRLIGNHMNLNITDKLFNFFNHGDDGQKIINDYINSLLIPDTKINVQHIGINDLGKIDQINIKKIYFQSFKENTQRIILKSSLLHNNFTKRIISSIPKLYQYPSLTDLLNVLTETKVHFKNKKYDYSEISQETKLIQIEGESIYQSPFIEMDIQKEQYGLQIKKLELMETKYSNILKTNPFKNSGDLIKYMEESNENIYIAMNTLNSEGLFDIKFFNYFIKFQVHLLQFLSFQFRKNENFKDLNCDFQIICKNKKQTEVFKTAKHNIKLLSEEKQGNENHFYDDTKYANIVLSRTNLGEAGIGTMNITNIETSNNIGSRFSRTNSCHFEKFFDIEDMFLLKTNHMLPYSPYDMLLLNQIECKELKQKTILKPYNLLILNEKRQKSKGGKESKPKNKNENECKNVLLSTLNTVNEKFIDPNDEIKTAYNNIKILFNDFWNNNEIVLKELKNTFKVSSKTDVFSLQYLTGNKTKGKEEKKGTYPILGKYLKQAIGTKNPGKQSQDKYTNRNYMISLFFDYLFLEELISTIEIKINIGEEPSFSKVFSINDKNIVIQHANKGNDPVLTEFPFYDIEKKIFDTNFESVNTSKELQSMILEKINERKRNEYYFNIEKSIAIISAHEAQLRQGVEIDTVYIDSLIKYKDKVKKYYGPNNLETHQHIFRDTTPGDIIFYMIEDLKYESRKTFKEIANYKNLEKKDEDHVYSRVDLFQFPRNLDYICSFYKEILIQKITKQYNETKNILFKKMLMYINSKAFRNINNSFNMEKEIPVITISSKEEEYINIDEDEEIMILEEKEKILNYIDLRSEDSEEDK